MGAVKIRKAEEEKRLVYGEVLAPNRPIKPDAGTTGVDDYATAEEIEAIAHRFMKGKLQKNVDQQHDNVAIDGCTVVESFIAREGDPDFIPGSWVVCVHVDDDDLWEAIKEGEINGFSLEAETYKDEVEVELDIPSTLTGTTSETEGHAHRFAVKYNDEGKFIGGATDTVDGHWHKIIAGTVTQKSNGHNHTFSVVDNVTVKEVEEDD